MRSKTNELEEPVGKVVLVFPGFFEDLARFGPLDRSVAVRIKQVLDSCNQMPKTTSVVLEEPPTVESGVTVEL